MLTHAKPPSPQPENTFEALDHMAHATVAKATSGLSRSALSEAWMDWAAYLAVSPDMQLQLTEQTIKNSHTLWSASLGSSKPTLLPDWRF